MVTAWTIGVGLLLAADVIWFICLQAKVFPAVFLLLVQISPLIAALVSAYLAPRKKVFLGISIAIPALTVLLAVLPAIYFGGLTLAFGPGAYLLLFIAGVGIPI